MKSKLAVFDFDLTIREVDKNNDWQYGIIGCEFFKPTHTLPKIF